MNYLRIYNELISHRIKNEQTCEYKEKHHILPKCMGGTNLPSNLVYLSAREHYIAHALLFKHYKTTKLAHAWFMMLKCGKGQQRKHTSRQYSLASKCRAKVMSENSKGNKNHFYGKTHTEETKRKISIANKGRKKLNKK